MTWRWHALHLCPTVLDREIALQYRKLWRFERKDLLEVRRLPSTFNLSPPRNCPGRTGKNPDHHLWSPMMTYVSLWRHHACVQSPPTPWNSRNIHRPCLQAIANVRQKIIEKSSVRESIVSKCLKMSQSCRALYNFARARPQMELGLQIGDHSKGLHFLWPARQSSHRTQKIATCWELTFAFLASCCLVFILVSFYHPELTVALGGLRVF